MKYRNPRSLLFFSVLFFTIVSFVLWVALFIGTKERPLEVTFLDVGQGDAIFIESPEGTQVLIDGGRGTKVLRELSKVMPFWDRSIDVVVATHPDADHIGGLPYVLERFKVAQVLQTSVESDTAVFHVLENDIDKEKARVISPRRGTRLILDGSAVLTILSRDVSKVSKTNDASIVIRLDYGETSFLFTADATKDVERELLQFHKALDVDVLKVGHHGSNSSSSSEFLSATSPNFAVISVGAHNSYGHPTKQVLDRLSASGAKVFRTDTDGTLHFISDGEVILEKKLGFFAELLGI